MAFWLSTNRSGPCAVVTKYPSLVGDRQPLVARRDEAQFLGRPLVQLKAQRHRHRRLDPAAVDFAVPLRRMAVATREEHARHINGKEDPRPRRQVADVDVAAVLARRRRPQPPGFARPHTHDTAERFVRDADVVAEDALIPHHLVVVDVRLREVLRQQPKVGNDAVPAPTLVLQVQDLHLQRVPRLRAVDKDRPGQRMDRVKRERRHVRIGGLRRELARRCLQRLKDDRVARRDRQARRQCIVPKRMRLRIVKMMGSHDSSFQDVDGC